MLTRRELAALALAAAAAPLASCGDDERWHDVGAFDAVPEEYWTKRELVVEGLEEIPWPLYVRRNGETVAALDSLCTHKGCPVRYVYASERFICPCHGAVFDARGRPESGPAKRPLRRREARVVDGRVQVAWPS